MKEKLKLELFKKIDDLVKSVRDKGNLPEINKVLDRRRRLSPEKGRSDKEAFKTLVRIISYSQGANSKLISELLLDPLTTEVFCNYDPQNFVNLSSSSFEKNNWNHLKKIRFKKKIPKYFDAARSILELSDRGNGFYPLVFECIPNYRVRNKEELSQFWLGFDELLFEMAQAGVPHLDNTTSLLHFLMDQGFDCIKPDLIIMRESRTLGIIKRQKDKEPELRMVTRTLQEYAYSRDLRPSEVDFYFLIQGQQKLYKDLLKKPK